MERRGGASGEKVVAGSKIGNVALPVTVCVLRLTRLAGGGLVSAVTELLELFTPGVYPDLRQVLFEG